MRKLMLAAAFAALTGCAAYVGPQGTYIEPLVPPIVIGPPVIVAPPPGIIVQPLPPVYVVPGRHVYFYGNAYYYNWGGGWYWSRHQQGPWQELPRDRWPSRMDQHGDGPGQGHGGRYR